MGNERIIDFNSLLERTKPLIDPNLPNLQQIQYKNHLKRQENFTPAPVDEDWVNEQRSSAFVSGYKPNNGMEGYKPNVPGLAINNANRASGVGLGENVPEDNSNIEQENNLENGNTQEQINLAPMFQAIHAELTANDNGSALYALNVLRRLPSVFSRFENADASRVMPYFLAGQQGRQRETERIGFGRF